MARILFIEPDRLLGANARKIFKRAGHDVNWQVDPQAAIDSADALLRSAVRSRQVAESRYQSGVGNLPDLLSVQASEASARMEVISAEMAWYANLSRLNNAIGIFTSETGIK